MAELEIHHEGSEHDPMGRKVGVAAAILAVLLAVVTIASHRAHTAAIIHKSTANDDWAYYQANSIKLHNVEVGEGLLDALNAKGEAVDKMRARFADQESKYNAQKDQQLEKAKSSDETAEGDERRALRYDIGEGLLEIALVLTSLYFIARRRMFPVVGCIAALAGVAIALTGLIP